MYFLKRIICGFLIIGSILTLVSCTKTTSITPTNAILDNGITFTKQNGNFISSDGTEYTFLAHEGDLYWLGEETFLGGIVGEKPTSEHIITYQTGFYALEQDPEHNILIRRSPNNEWRSIYRKASLPPLDYSLENCIRLELISEGLHSFNAVHATCGEGITDPDEIQNFLTDVLSQQSPDEAGYYDFVRQPDGSYQNCSTKYAVYGFFKDEPSVVVAMYVTSFNDQGYSIYIDNQEYVLPSAWMEKLMQS